MSTVPSCAARTKTQWLATARFWDIKPFDGGIAFTYLPLFGGEPARLVVDEIVSFHYRSELDESRVIAVNLKIWLEDAINEAEKEPNPEDHWAVLLPSMLVEARKFEKMWVGRDSTMPNPVAYFFFGPPGIFSGDLSFPAIKERLRTFDSTKLPISVSLQEETKGDGFLISYKPKTIINEPENPPVQ
jgi:hypothetical protein